MLLIMLFSWLLLACFWLNHQIAEANQAQVVNVEGKLSLPSVAQYLKKNIPQEEKVETVLAVLDCSSSIGESTVINELLGTSFAPLSNGISMEYIKPQKALVLRGCFDSMFSSRSCGAKLSDFFGRFPRSDLYLLLKIDDLSEAREIYDQLFRRVLSAISERSEEERRGLTVVIDLPPALSSDQEKEAVALETIRGIIQQILSEVSPSEGAAIPVEVMRLSEETGSQLREKLLSSSSVSALDLSPSDFAQRLKKEWDKIPATPLPLLRRGEEVALVEIEEAYAESLLQAELALSQMTRRIGEGRVLLHFPQRITRLLASVLSHFNGLVRGNHLLRQRIERTKTLRAFILTNAERLFQQLLQIQEIEQTNQFQREIVKVFKKFGLDYSSSSSEGEGEEVEKKNPPLTEALKQLVRRKSFDFASSVKQLEDVSLGLIVPESLLKEFSEKLETLAAAFPESSEAKLLELKRLEKQVSRPPSTSRGRGRGRKKRSLLGSAVGVSLSLVGMLRPPGFGNLQGFVGYNRPVLGIPVDFLLGIQNDGDSMEIMADDREHPLLRVQPKFNFEVNF